MALKIYVDGSSLGNPGPAGIGIVVCDEEGNIVATHKVSLGNATNNEAEYKAVIEALKLAQKLGAEEVTLLSDSELVVQQLSGNFKVRSSTLRPLYEVAVNLARQFRRLDISHIPRKANKMANKLAQEASFAAISKDSRVSGRCIKISPSILSADFRRLGETVRELEAGGANLKRVVRIGFTLMSLTVVLHPISPLASP